MLVTQNGVPFFQAEELTTSLGHFRTLFADSTCYTASIPTYVGGHMAMGFATDDKGLRRMSAETIAERYARAGSFATQYWTPELHLGAFALPRFIADLVAAATKGSRRIGRNGSLKARTKDINVSLTIVARRTMRFHASITAPPP